MILKELFNSKLARIKSTVIFWQWHVCSGGNNLLQQFGVTSGPLQLLLSVIYLQQLLGVSVSFTKLGKSCGQKKDVRSVITQTGKFTVCYLLHIQNFTLKQTFLQVK